MPDFSTSRIPRRPMSQRTMTRQDDHKLTKITRTHEATLISTALYWTSLLDLSTEHLGKTRNLSRDLFRTSTEFSTKTSEN